MKEDTMQFLCNVYGEFHREMWSCKDELKNLEKIVKWEGLKFQQNPVLKSFKLVESKLIQVQDADTRTS